ncbi:MAG: hypothetical protein BWY82_00219 [Verrucomicrobia bacterium ADurb.Bin474]|nr:MAG: hypothetical protein BWY82_00219 [Verrucomicrobia bacterium ADurb.Bin474]
MGVERRILHLSREDFGHVFAGVHLTLPCSVSRDAASCDHLFKVEPTHECFAPLVEFS